MMITMHFRKSVYIRIFASLVVGLLIAGCGHIQTIDTTTDDLTAFNDTMIGKTVKMEIETEDLFSARNVVIDRDSTSFQKVIIRGIRPDIQYLDTRSVPTSSVRSITVSYKRETANKGMIIGLVPGILIGGLFAYARLDNVSESDAFSIGIPELGVILGGAGIFGGIGAVTGSTIGTLCGRTETYRFQLR